MTRDEADLELGKIVREAISKAMPLDYSRAVERYVTVDLDGLGIVLVKFEVLGTQQASKH